MSYRDDDDEAGVYEKMLRIYHLLINGNYDRPSRSYFQQIADYYEIGGRMTKIRAIEIVLRILQGRVIMNPKHVKPIEHPRPAGMGIVQYRLQQIRERVEGKSSPIRTETKKIHQASNIDMIAWLEEKLMSEEDSKILTTFFIFIKSNIDSLSSSGSQTSFQLMKLHKSLLENKAYKKMASFDRLWFS